MLRICWVGYAMDRRRFDGQRNDMKSEGTARTSLEWRSEEMALNSSDRIRNGKATNCLVKEWLRNARKCGCIERLSDDMEWSCREQQRNGMAKRGRE